MKSSEKHMDKFQVSLDYLTEYSGVNMAVIADRDGLVVSRSPRNGGQEELFAAAGLEMVKIMDESLARIANPGCNFLSIKTGNDWVIVAQASIFYLIVRADRSVDDLLSVRVSRALEMITSHLNEEYPALMRNDAHLRRKTVKSTEAAYV